MISVVTGSTSLITVPVMIALGIEAHVAVATNMLALTFMSVGGCLPFVGKGVLNRRRLVPTIALTIIGSGLGAFLLLGLPLEALQITAEEKCCLRTRQLRDFLLSTSRPRTFARRRVTDRSI